MREQIADRIEKLQKSMRARDIDAYIIPTADYHQSEYVGDHFKSREFMTGFTGSAGTAVVTMREACLWTDGRYFIQAEEQLSGSGIILQKMGEPGVPDICEYLEEKLPEDAILGFDGRTIGYAQGMKYEEIVLKKHGSIAYQEDLVDNIWEMRPEISKEPAFLLEEKYAGESTETKLKRLRKVMKEKGTNLHILATLDDIDWLLNIRGKDVTYFPLLLSYAMVSMNWVDLYVDETKLDSGLKKYLEDNKVIIHPYDDIYEAVKEISKEENVLIDPLGTNYAMVKNISSDVNIINGENPTILMKSMKNATEIKNIRNAHIKDGVACTKFMYWLKMNIGKIKITEISASEKLEEFRRQQKLYMQPSFDPICAYKEHAAIVHYSATAESASELRKSGMVLMDTGANYYDGSTDITRTMALGPVSELEKEHFTLVAMANLRLADAKFLHGCTGANLDYAAREIFWKRGLDFKHGTGHGVGYLGTIHEGPIAFRWRIGEHNQMLEDGMIITDEPGLYIEGSHGIRTENELLVCESEENEYGQFMHLEPITFVPIDLELIKPEIMTEDDRKLLNQYHKQVFEKVSPYLDEKECRWLEKYTREI